MRPERAIATCLLAAGIVACDIFLEEVGGEGEPCTYRGECKGDLVCVRDECVSQRLIGEDCGSGEDYNHKNPPICEEGSVCFNGVCTAAGGDGQLCVFADDSAYDEYPDWIPDGGECDDGLRCIDGYCLAPLDSDEVKQPDADLYWLRCPVGGTWDGWECDFAYEFSDYWEGSGEAAQFKCPEGYRLPTRQEMIDLLGDCEAHVNQGATGDCAPCAESETCAGMFDVSYTAGTFWTSTKGSTNVNDYWWAGFSTGALTHNSSNDLGVRCLRDDG